MAFKDGGTVKKLAPGAGTVPGASAPVNPGSGAIGAGLGQFQQDLAPGPGTSTVKSGPMTPPQGAGEGLTTGSPISMPEGPSPNIPAPGSPGGGTSTQGSATGSSPSAGKPAYAPGKSATSDPGYNPGRARGAQGNSGGPAPLIRPEPSPAGGTPKGGPIIPKGAPVLGPMPKTSTMRPKGK